MMTIGQLVKDLERCKPSAQVYFDFCSSIPTTVDSWRGIYAEPALGWEMTGYGNRNPNPTVWPTVESLLAELKQSINGREYHGWKGGEYRYWSDSPLHIDNRGDCTHTELVRVEDGDWFVILHTGYDESGF